MTAYLDGNVLGGVLAGVFAADITTAVGRCDACGRAGPLGTALVYPDGPGTVVRCPACAEILLRVTRAGGRAWLDVRGLSSLQLELPDAARDDGGPGAEPGD
jgi:ribosomal protein S27E